MIRYTKSQMEQVENINELVMVNNNQVRDIAKNFGKLHKDVLESIRKILAAENSATKFFLESTYENRGKQYPEYLMNRDGFSLLVMGFKAMNWKIKYIEAFNEMEQQLKEQRYDKKEPPTEYELRELVVKKEMLRFVKHNFGKIRQWL